MLYRPLREGASSCVDYRVTIPWNLWTAPNGLLSFGCFKPYKNMWLQHWFLVNLLVWKMVCFALVVRDVRFLRKYLCQLFFMTLPCLPSYMRMWWVGGFHHFEAPWRCNGYIMFIIIRTLDVKGEVRLVTGTLRSEFLKELHTKHALIVSLTLTNMSIYWIWTNWSVIDGSLLVRFVAISFIFTELC